MTNISAYESDFNKLIKKGEILDTALKLQCHPEEVTKQINSVYKEKAAEFIKLLPRFNSDYQIWYTESKAIIKQLIPDRLNDFAKYYERPKTRKSIDYETYTIEDCLQGLCLRNGFGEITVDQKAAVSKFEQQLSILKSIESRFKSKLYDIQTMVQADLLDSEIDAAQVLLKNKFYRAAGAICGVVLEKHFLKIITDHGLKMIKKNPCISDFNDQLKQNEIVDIPTWRFIQHLADIRNLCDHNKEIEPAKEQIEDLINGVKKVIKTVF